MLMAILFAGCGNANNVGDNIQNNETESYARVWDKNPNVQRVDYTLKSSDISKKETDMIDEELQQCAEVITQLDQKMLEVRKKIDRI